MSIPVLRSALLAAMVALPSVSATPRMAKVAASGNPSYAVTNLFDGVFGYGYQVSDGSWFSVKPERAVDTLLLTWNAPAGSWSDSIATINSCKQGAGLPRRYSLLASANSTDGVNGTWDTLLNVSNHVSSRAHRVPFAGKTWLKVAIVSGGGQIDEVELFDAAALGRDSWFFMGNSITAGAFKGSIPDTIFSRQVTARVPGRTPAVVMGGIPCIKTPDAFADVSKYLALAGDCRFWGIELGTNDSWGGGTYFLPDYVKALAGLIDSAKAHGITPIVGRLIATDSSRAGWQVNPAFVNAVDSLVRVKGLPQGPDFHTWFRQHPDEFNTDGVHLSSKGAASMQRLWAAVAAGLEVGPVSVGPRSPVRAPARLRGTIVRGPAPEPAVDARGRTAPAGATRVDLPVR